MYDANNIKEDLILGIEFGSTRIKGVLIDAESRVIASGSHLWENRYSNGVWTYELSQIWEGLQNCYRKVVTDYKKRYGAVITSVQAIGISGMMHGYLVLDKYGKLLAPFRTWRNTITEQAATRLSELFGFNISQRWSIAHLYQAIINQEPNISEISYITTLAGYVHFMLTGEKVLGVGDASGMFPIGTDGTSYDVHMMKKFNEEISCYGFKWKLNDILPQVLPAGASAGILTETGAHLLDPTGALQAGIPLCPPEGDAGTGMVATNSVKKRTGNISAGTSIFAMVVLEKPLSRVYPQIDIVTTPEGCPVAMVHCNNCTSEINVWIEMLREFAQCIGVNTSNDDLYPILFKKALDGCPCGGGILYCNYISGEPVVGISEGRPILLRKPDSQLTLANFMRSQLNAAIATLKLGMDLLVEKEQVKIEHLIGHGGFFKTLDVGQKITAAAIGVPVAVLENAGEGGAWGIALLAGYMKYYQKMTLSSYLEKYVFSNMNVYEVQPDAKNQDEFTKYMQDYRRLLHVERAAIEVL